MLVGAPALVGGEVGAYNSFWLDRGTTVVPTRRTSLVVDPPSGRLPALTLEAERRITSPERRRLKDVREGRIPADSHEQFDLGDRCIWYRGVPSLPTAYNNNYHIVQTPDTVAIVQEHIHDVRFISLDGRPHIDERIGQYGGDSLGHWEGDTLVVDVTDFNGRNWFDRAGNFHSDALHLEERFTFLSADAIQYEVTIEDPNTFTQPWRISMPLYRRLEPNMQLLEYQCIEFVEEFLYGHVRKEPLVTRWEGETMIVEITRKVPPGDEFYEWYRK